MLSYKKRVAQWSCFKETMSLRNIKWSCIIIDWILLNQLALLDSAHYQPPTCEWEFYHLNSPVWIHEKKTKLLRKRSLWNWLRWSDKNMNIAEERRREVEWVSYRETFSVLIPLSNTLFFIPLPFNKLLWVPSAESKIKGCNFQWFWIRVIH